MREILFAGCALMLAACATPNMVASNGSSDQQQGLSPSSEDREPPPPPQLRQPARRGWGGNIYRGRYAY